MPSTYDFGDFEHSWDGGDVAGVELALPIVGDDLDLAGHMELQLLLFLLRSGGAGIGDRCLLWERRIERRQQSEYAQPALKVGLWRDSDLVCAGLWKSSECWISFVGPRSTVVCVGSSSERSI